jgi:hypothetical protein
MQVDNPSDLAQLTAKSDWFLFLRQVPTWERERMAEEIRKIPLDTHEGFRQLNQFFLAEVTAGNLPAKFLNDLAPILKNLFASIVMERAEVNDKAGNGIRELVTKLTVERRETLTGFAPAYSGLEVVPEPDRVKLLG